MKLICLIGFLLALGLSACLRPSPRRYQKIIHGFSVARLDSLGQYLDFCNTPGGRWNYKVRVNKFVPTTEIDAFFKDSIRVRNWYWDGDGRLQAYHSYDKNGQRKLEIQGENLYPVKLRDGRNFSDEDTFRVEVFRHNQPWKGLAFEGRRLAHRHRSGKFQISYYPDGRREVKLDAMPDDKVRRARLWDENGKCIADTTFNPPKSVSAIRPRVDVLLRSIAHRGNRQESESRSHDH